MIKIFELNELDCPVCAAKAEKRVLKVKAVKNGSIDFVNQRLTVECDEYNEELLKEITSAVQKVEKDCEVTPVD